MGNARRNMATIAASAAVALVLASCVPPPGGGGPTTTTTTTSTTTTTTIPTVTIPGFEYTLPSLSVDLPPVGVDFGCSATYDPPSISLAGPTITVPATTLDVTTGSVPLSGVTLNGFSSTVSLGSFTISCPIPFLPPLQYTSSVSATLSANAAVVGASFRFSDLTVVLPATSLMLTPSLKFEGFGGLTIPLSPVTVNVPGAEIPVSI